MNRCKKRYKKQWRLRKCWYVSWYSRFINSPLVHHYFCCNVPNLYRKGPNLKKQQQLTFWCTAFQAATILQFSIITICLFYFKRQTGLTQALNVHNPSPGKSTLHTTWKEGDAFVLKLDDRLSLVTCQTDDTHCAVKTVHDFMLYRNLEGKKAPSPSLPGEPHGLSSPQLMSSEESSLWYKNRVFTGC